MNIWPISFSLPICSNICFRVAIYFSSITDNSSCCRPTSSSSASARSSEAFVLASNFRNSRRCRFSSCLSLRSRSFCFFRKVVMIYPQRQCCAFSEALLETVFQVLSYADDARLFSESLRLLHQATVLHESAGSVESLLDQKETFVGLVLSRLLLRAADAGRLDPDSSL